jgi:hypothetical protein
MPPHPGFGLRYNSPGARARLTLRFFELISRVITQPPISASPSRRFPYFLFFAFFAAFTPCFAQQVRLPAASGGVAELSSSGPQQQKGDLFIADGDVDITYGGMRLRADHADYNNATSEASVRGHVLFDFENQHLEGDDGVLNVASGRGTFHNVHGTIRLERGPNPTLLITQNPLYFEAREVERVSPDVYIIRHAWFTICDPALLMANLASKMGVNIVSAISPPARLAYLSPTRTSPVLTEITLSGTARSVSSEYFL